MTFRNRHRTILAALCLFVLGIACALPAIAQKTVRIVSGSVTDSHHEPLRDAVVELQNPDSHSIVSYVTQTNGQYNFKNLDGNSDYLIWVLWRGHKSKIRSISKFDSHMAKVINFTVQPY